MLHTYSDSAGVEHRVVINFATRLRIKKDHGIDLLQCAADPKLLHELLMRMTDDDEFFFRLLATIEGVSAESLMSVADGTSHEKAVEALFGALVQFFPQSSPMRNPLNAYVQSALSCRALMLQEIESRMMAEVEKTDFSTVLLESPTLTNGFSESSPVSESLSGA
jgi:hypothetical protein